jgi:hypothetical protein
VPGLAALRTSAGDGHLYVVAHDGRVWTNCWQDGEAPAGWSALGSPLFPKGANVVVLCNRLQDRDLFVLGRDARLWNTCWVTDKPWKQWRGWEALGGRRFPAGAGVAATTVARTGDVAAFVVDADGRLWMVRFPDPERGRELCWSRFAVIDGPPLAAGGPVCAISSGHARDLAVLALGRDGRVWTAATTWPVPAPPTPWGEWSALGGLSAISFRAVRDGDGASDVIAVGQDGRLHAASAPTQGAWGPWSPIGQRRPPLDGAIVVLAGSKGERRVLMLGRDRRVWTNVRSEGGSGRWAAIGARRFAAGASIAALGDRESEHQVFVLDVDGRVRTSVARLPNVGGENSSVLQNGRFPMHP